MNLGILTAGYSAAPPRVVDCRGVHFSEWRPDLGYWVCGRCDLPLDEKRRPGGLESRWVR